MTSNRRPSDEWGGGATGACNAASPSEGDGTSIDPDCSTPAPNEANPLQERVETGRRDWSAYNRGQAHEAFFFTRLLYALVTHVPDPQRQGRGRRPIPRQILAYCGILKTWHGLSNRRLYGLLLRDGELWRVPRYNAVGDFFNATHTEEYLRGLVRLSAAPLVSLETSLSIDSTGLRSTRFEPWTGWRREESRRHHWVKAHLLTGNTTHAVAEAILSPGTDHDGPYLRRLVRDADRWLPLDGRDLCADRAYSSRDNVRLVEGLGAVPLIPFRRGSGGVPQGGRPQSAWTRAWHYYNYHHAEFLQRYHQRSNVEASIGALKRQLGGTVFSKKARPQRNEALAKIVAYNLSLLTRDATEDLINGRTDAARLFENLPENANRSTH